jgi:hypothetical protein
MATASDGSFVYTNSGQLYLRDAQGQWHEWVGGAMVAVNDPTTGLSTDNTRAEAGTGGELVTMDGAFSFGAEADAAGNYAIFLNAQNTGGRAVELAIFGGQIHARPLSPIIPGGSAGWYLWAAGRWIGMN